MRPSRTRRQSSVVTMDYKTRRRIRHGSIYTTSVFDEYDERTASMDERLRSRSPSPVTDSSRSYNMMTASYTESSQSDLVPTRNMKSTRSAGNPYVAVIDDRSLTARERARVLVMSTSMYTPSSYTHSHPGYAPLRTHYAFGAVSGLGSTYHRNPHQSYGSYTPVARISPPYAYVRPQSTLSARFEYNYPTAYITRTFIEATEDTTPLRSTSLTRCHSGCGGWTALASMKYTSRRPRCYPASDYAREKTPAMQHGRVVNAMANVDRLEFEHLNAKVATLEADKMALRDRVDTLERELKFKQMDMDAMRSGAGGDMNPETEREMKVLQKDLKESRAEENTLRSSLEAAQEALTQLGGSAVAAEPSSAENFGDLDAANAEIASLHAIKMKLETDMQALQAHMVEAIEDLAKPSEGELANSTTTGEPAIDEQAGVPDEVEDEFVDAPAAEEEKPKKKKPFLKGQAKTKQ